MAFPRRRKKKTGEKEKKKLETKKECLKYATILKICVQHTQACRQVAKKALEAYSTEEK